jgi:hypothetical protein
MLDKVKQQLLSRRKSRDGDYWVLWLDALRVLAGLPVDKSGLWFKSWREVKKGEVGKRLSILENPELGLYGWLS